MYILTPSSLSGLDGPLAKSVAELYVRREAACETERLEVETAYRTGVVPPGYYADETCWGDPLRVFGEGAATIAVDLVELEAAAASYPALASVDVDSTDAADTVQAMAELLASDVLPSRLVSALRCVSDGGWWGRGPIMIGLVRATNRLAERGLVTDSKHAASLVYLAAAVISHSGLAAFINEDDDQEALFQELLSAELEHAEAENG